MDFSRLDPKVAAIYKAAYDVFVSYGYKRTTMDDIARAAGMSRPALYVHFKNKEAIFRGFVAFFLDQVADEAESILFGQTDVSEGLKRFFEAAFVTAFKDLITTPHGMELAGVNKDIAGDISADWFERLEHALAGWLKARATGGALSLRGVEPDELARLLIDAVEGIKLRASGMEQLEREMALLAEMTSRAYGSVPFSISM